MNQNREHTVCCSDDGKMETNKGFHKKKGMKKCFDSVWSSLKQLRVSLQQLMIVQNKTWRPLPQDVVTEERICLWITDDGQRQDNSIQLSYS